MKYPKFKYVANILSLIFSVTISHAQTFGTPELENKNYRQMMTDIANMEEIIRFISDYQKDKLQELSPKIQNRSILEKWNRDNEIIERYRNLFDEAHGASVVLMNSLALSLQIKDNSRPPFHLRQICMYMPGSIRIISFGKKQGDRSVIKFWSNLGHDQLDQPLSMKIKDGLEMLDGFADSYNAICARAGNFKNWESRVIK